MQNADFIKKTYRLRHLYAGALRHNRIRTEEFFLQRGNFKSHSKSGKRALIRSKRGNFDDLEEF